GRDHPGQGQAGPSGRGREPDAFPGVPQMRFRQMTAARAVFLAAVAYQPVGINSCVHPATEEAMLVLSRRLGEEVVIAGTIRVTIRAANGGRVRIGIAAPPSVTVNRKEVQGRPGKAETGLFLA